MVGSGRKVNRKMRLGNRAKVNRLMMLSEFGVLRTDPSREASAENCPIFLQSQILAGCLSLSCPAAFLCGRGRGARGPFGDPSVRAQRHLTVGWEACGLGRLQLAAAQLQRSAQQPRLCQR